MPRHHQPRLRKTLLALAASAALAPHASWALSLAQSPPSTTTPYVRPNVILTLDDSTSMNDNMFSASGVNLGPRTKVLKNAVIDTFSDTSLLPDGKIRLAWQTMGNCTVVDGQRWAPTLDATSTTNKNVMRSLEGTHRANFLRYMGNYAACTNTPTHDMVRNADAYMRAPLNQNGPWALEPGQTAAPYLGCRRNYHILLTDGGWNGSERQTTPRNYDGTNHTLPDGTPYDTSSTQTQLYRDSENYTTIADWAFYSWSTALQTGGLIGSPVPSGAYLSAPPTETFTNRSTLTTATLEKFWNPRYDPATWPHMVTYTIGFSSDALPKNNYLAGGARSAAVIKPTSMLPYGYDGNLADYANGTYSWRAYASDRGHDMWHAALNSRGEFYAVEKGEDLKQAFREIIGQINAETVGTLTATAASGFSSSRTDVGIFTAGYDPKSSWKGFVMSRLVKTDGTTVPNPAWGGQTTADKLDGLGSITSRVVLSWSDRWNGITLAPKGGVSFKWISGADNLSTAQQAHLGANSLTPVANSGENILNYIRGDRSLEGADPDGYTAAKPFRQRSSRQGDIINSAVWFTGAPVSNYALKGYSAFTRAYKSRTPMIYVGGNDGMLHGFSAANGDEKIAYVPRGVIPTLKDIALPAFNQAHKYYVDGSPMTGDVDMGTGVQDPDDPAYDASYIPNWRTLLVGTLGAGGKGYFVLDVTDPTAFNDSNAQDLIKLDRTRGSSEVPPDCSAMSGAQKAACETAIDQDKDIGHITAQPVLDESNGQRTTQITRMNNNRWAVVLGNGYNSANQRPVLLVQYLDGAKELLRIPVTSDAPGTGNANDNGLSAPRLVDLNGDGRPDVAYAGDNLGNLWKFDLTSPNQSDWLNLAFGGSPLFTARGPATFGAAVRNLVQPITIPPTVRANDRMKTDGRGGFLTVGGLMVAFGTGRNVTETDPTNNNVQTLYSVLDNTRYRARHGYPKLLEVHPGGGICPSGSDCVPAPAALGTGVTTAKLAEQKITGVGLNFGKIDPVITLDQSTWNNYNGWYMDFAAAGERQLKPLEFYDGSNILTVYSQIPARGTDATTNSNSNIETCTVTSVTDEVQFRTFINIQDGKRPSIQIVDMNGDGAFNASDGGVSRRKVKRGSHNLIGKSKTTTQDVDMDGNQETLARMPEQALRPSWRQLK